MMMILLDQITLITGIKMRVHIPLTDVRRVHLVSEGRYLYQCNMCYQVFNTRADIGEHLALKEYEAME